MKRSYLHINQFDMYVWEIIHKSYIYYLWQSSWHFILAAEVHLDLTCLMAVPFIIHILDNERYNISKA